jgi:hypothetical protein
LKKKALVIRLELDRKGGYRIEELMGCEENVKECSKDNNCSKGKNNKGNLIYGNHFPFEF